MLVPNFHPNLTYIRYKSSSGKMCHRFLNVTYPYMSIRISTSEQLVPRIDALCKGHLSGNARFSSCHGLKARSILKTAGSCIKWYVGKLQLRTWNGRERIWRSFLAFASRWQGKLTQNQITCKTELISELMILAPPILEEPPT